MVYLKIRGLKSTYSQGLLYDLILPILDHEVKTLVLEGLRLGVFEILIFFLKVFHVAADIIL